MAGELKRIFGGYLTKLLTNDFMQNSAIDEDLQQLLQNLVTVASHTIKLVMNQITPLIDMGDEA